MSCLPVLCQLCAFDIKRQNLPPKSDVSRSEQPAAVKIIGPLIRVKPPAFVHRTYGEPPLLHPHLPPKEPSSLMTSVAAGVLNRFGTEALPTLVTSQRVPGLCALFDCAGSAASGDSGTNANAEASVRKRISMMEALEQFMFYRRVRMCVDDDSGS